MKNSNVECLEIAKLLWIEAFEKNIVLPLDKLDYTENSIVFLNDFLLENRSLICSLETKFYTKFILRVGCYLGETIKILLNSNFDWYSYDDLLTINDDVKKIEKSLYTYYILSNKNRINLFPLAKLDKLLKNGESDDLIFYLKSLKEFIK